jgi:DNA repair and recombination protein RAD54B
MWSVTPECHMTEPVLRIIHARNGATNIHPGAVLNLGGKEICIDHAISPDDFLSGACFDIEPAPFQLCAPLSTVPTPGHSILPKASIPKVPMRPVLPRMADVVSKQTMPLVESRPNKLSADDEKTRYWTAQWRKPQTKKNKSWDGDGYVSQCGAKVVFMDEDGIAYVQR